MQVSVDLWAPLISRLSQDLVRLEVAAASLQLTPLRKREWFELLCRKLQPQLGSHPYLIVAVVGGTNIGKSVVFNHLAGEHVSSMTPLASGTKHPTALLSETLHEHADLEQIFAGFQVVRATDATQPLQANPEHQLFYRVSPRTPENLIILDTPDIDSVEEVNWERADYLRQSADVLIAVLTQQKYNDAAVKEFFRKATQEGKLVIIVFNQCLLPDDEAYWPLWIRTFCNETGTHPHLIYLAPYDRRAAESLQLPFYERSWPAENTASDELTRPRQLLQELSQLKFDEIKTQALSGALKHLVDPSFGIPSWLNEIQERSRAFADAFHLLSGDQLVEVARWPMLPNSVLIEQVRGWWRDQREGWTAGVHGFYQRLGEVISIPVRAVMNRSASPTETPLERYRQQEWDAILDVVERCLQRLEWARDLGNPILASRLESLLDGGARGRLISQLRTAHDAVDFEAEIRGLVDRQLKTFREERPDSYKLFRRVDSMAAAARPAVSVALFITGAGPLGDAIAPLVAETAFQSVLHLAGETVGGTVVTAVGDKVITDAASGGAGYLEAKFRQLHTGFVKQRAEWLINQFHEHLLGSLSQELNEASQLPLSEDFKNVSRLVDELKQMLLSRGIV
ncbi:GTPase [Planctomicrobium sp. SH661]|uniref:GTPase n=1 Tax=Planctomicrobium sp. SH661 TaxID=3448124 RepID=UPI003F5B117C